MLDQLRPDCILLEGPPDAQDLLTWAGHAQMSPPVAILIYAADDPARAVYYPFASFSPEWNTIRWARANRVPLRFCDLPQSNRLAIDIAEEETVEAKAETESPTVTIKLPEQPSEAVVLIRNDPLGELARAAGFDDGERWWEHVVEHRRGEGAEADIAMFAVICEAMGALREKNEFGRQDDPLREAYMRRTMRDAEKGGFNKIAVICGAFHAPALANPIDRKKDDDVLLKGLPKIKTAATWVPWTHDLLTMRSGYGAGVHSPGWYEHVFNHDSLILERWMTRIARLFRDEDIDCSSAHVIESVRLANALAAMRTRPIPDLSDIADAARSVFCHESDAPMQLIGRKLLVGDVIGEVPDETPQVPLQQDLARLQKSLRLKPEALEKQIELDLRNENDLARSQLLYRLRLLGINWGTQQSSGARSKGTFKEPWRLRWDPHFAIRLIQAARYGNTVKDAASGIVRSQLIESPNDLAALARLLDVLLLADLPEALDALLRQIDTVAAIAADVAVVMDALPPLARAARYGTVRQTNTELLGDTIAGILPRIIAGLPPAVGNLNDDAAAMFSTRIIAVNESVALLTSTAEASDASPEQTADPSARMLDFKNDWMETLDHLLHLPNTHGQIQGKSARLLFDAGKLGAAEINIALSLALSRAAEPAHAAAWLQGFLEHSGLILIHDPKLLSTIDNWVGAIQQDTFDAILPLLRRTFSTFAAPERRQIGQQLAKGKSMVADGNQDNETPIDEARARRVIPILKLILGIKS
ncbi:MAG TPA: DUF5682 family protein [Tepidisphaeraceae bacterium]|nr:DUF5682 family protein [Tepidisphaeraceae bacterium]